MPPELPVTREGTPDVGAMRSMRLDKEADAYEDRMLIVSEAQAAAGTPHGGKTAAKQRIADERGVSRATVYRLAALERDGGPTALVPRWGAGRGATRAFAPELQNQIIEAYLWRRNGTATAVHRDLVVPYFSADGRQCPQVSTTRRLIRKYVRPLAELARRGPRALAAEGMAKVRRERPSEPNMAWSADHRLCPVRVDDGGHLLRVWATVIFDLASGALVGYRLGRTPTAAGVCYAIRHALQGFGVPKLFQRDNGREFTARRLGGEARRLQSPHARDLEGQRRWPAVLPANADSQGVWAALGVQLTTCLPVAPWGKGAEALLRAFFGAWECDLPGYCGRSPESRPERLAADEKAGRLLTLDEFRGLFAQQVERWNMSHVCGDRPAPPLTMYETHQAEHPEARWRPDPAALSFLLEDERQARVYDDGVRMGGRCWWGRNLELHVGERVRVRYDAEDPGWAFAYTADREVILLTPEPRATWDGFGDGNLRCEERRQNQGAYLAGLARGVAGSAPLEALDPTGAHRLVAARLKAAGDAGREQQRALSAAVVIAQRHADPPGPLATGRCRKLIRPAALAVAQAADLLTADLEALRLAMMRARIGQAQVMGLTHWTRSKTSRVLSGRPCRTADADLGILRSAVTTLLAVKGKP